MMRTGLLTAAAIVAVAFSGVAQASVITETFTGFINSGTDSVGAFGITGADLAGDAITFSFSYDTGLMQADIDANTDGSDIYINPSDVEYRDYAGDSALTESVTINSQTLTIANSSSPLPGDLEGCTTTVCGADGVLTVFDQVASRLVIATSVNTTQNYSTGDDLFSQSEVDALVGGGVTTGDIYITNGSAQDYLAISNVSTESATPEPTTWTSLALGFGMVGLLKRRRSAR